MVDTDTIADMPMYTYKPARMERVDTEKIFETMRHMDRMRWEVKELTERVRKLEAYDESNLGETLLHKYNGRV